MRVHRLWLHEFRSYPSAELELAPDGLTVILGSNGQGKTNLLEAIGYLATLTSFRGAPGEALVRMGADTAVVRAEGERDGRELLLEAAINRTGRDRVLVNRQPLKRARDLLGALRITVFAPDDLVLVKGGPGDRRRYLDDLLVSLHPRNDGLRADVERIVRQRTTLLKQAGGRLSPEVGLTLDVWDSKLATAGTALVRARLDVVRKLEPVVAKAYDQVASSAADVHVRYVQSWEGDLADALAAARSDDIRRGVTSVGPHRDDLDLVLAGLPARTHASQGEQRSLALALRLASHDVVTEATGSAPILLLDDVFSELDPGRGEALTRHLPAGQAVLTTAGELPHGATAAQVVRIAGGRVLA